MSGIKPTQKIFDLVKDIKEDEYRLPSIQRSFVWEEERICKLMDSLMNDYPIGSCLVWKPNTDIKIRTKQFILNYKTGMRLISEDDQLESLPYLLLDGQQRLQSLFISFFGKYDDKRLYLKIDSDPTSEENDLRYQFQFMADEKAAKDPRWRRVQELTNIKIPKISAFVDKEFENDPTEVKERIKENIAKFIQVFCIEDKMHIQEVKEDLPYNDVLEVFVRVNSGGITLAKSDLLFSTVILHSPEMEGEFIKLVDELNGRGEYDFDTDFLIKTSFVLLNRGAKYDIRKLKSGDYIKMLQRNFDKIRKSLYSTLEFLKNDARILAKRFLKSDLALIPVIDFIFQLPHQQLLEGQAGIIRQYLYMSFFMRFYSYGPDAKLDAIHNIFKEIAPLKEFPISKIASYLEERTGMSYAVSEKTLLDLDLILNIIEGGINEIPKRRGWSLERDHIFPNSVLTKMGISEGLINSVGNFRYLNKIRNILKSDDLPDESCEFYGSKDSTLTELFLQARNNLDEENFGKFVRKRSELIRYKVAEFLGFGSGHYHV